MLTGLSNNIKKPKGTAMLTDLLHGDDITSHINVFLSFAGFINQSGIVPNRIRSNSMMREKTKEKIRDVKQ